MSVIKYMTCNANNYIQKIECIRDDSDFVYLKSVYQDNEYSAPKMTDRVQYHDTYETAEEFLRNRGPANA